VIGWTVAASALSAKKSGSIGTSAGPEGPTDVMVTLTV
jgi:hypothetical protein